MFDPETGIFAANMAMRKLAESGQVGYSGSKVIFPTTKLNTMIVEGYPVAGWSAKIVPLDLTNGQSIKIIWNGVGYDYVTTVINEGDGINVVLGNMAFVGLGVDTGEPFLLHYHRQINLDDLPGQLNVVTAEPTTATLSISTETVHPIDPKYLPGPPHFDLREMGLPAVPLDGSAVMVECDITELRNAMLTGAVSITASAAVGGTYNTGTVTVIVNNARIEETGVIQATSILLNTDVVYAVFFTIYATGVRAEAIPLITQ